MLLILLILRSWSETTIIHRPTVMSTEAHDVQRTRAFPIAPSRRARRQELGINQDDVAESQFSCSEFFESQFLSFELGWKHDKN
jgi:hypothetical protein